jgi:hypothetical protein
MGQKKTHLFEVGFLKYLKFTQYYPTSDFRGVSVSGVPATVICEIVFIECFICFEL